MALTPLKREILIEARQRILEVKETYLCYAISYVSGHHPTSPATSAEKKKAGEELEKFVAGAVDTHDGTTLQCWQISNGFGLRSPKQQRRDRLDWIDWMLGEK